MRQDLVADAKSGDHGPDGAHHAGGFHAQRQRRRAAHVPAARSHEVIPIANTSGVHRDQQLVGVRDLGLWQLQALDRASVCQDACASHMVQLPSGRGVSSSARPVFTAKAGR